VNLETLFTTEAGFNVQDATPLQRGVCRVSQGLPVADLATHPHVCSGFGGASAVAALPVGEVPKEEHLVGPSRSGKSKLMAADSICAGQTVDPSGADVGDIIRVSVLGLTTRTNAIWTHLCERVANQPVLRRLLIGDMKDSVFAMRHPTGRPIEYMLVPIDKWGGSVISVYSAGCYIDEEPRQIGAEDGVKSWTGVHDAVIGRMLPGAKFFGGGAPWAPQGPIYELVGDRFGKPGPDLVIVRGTGPMWNPAWWTPERCADLERRNPTAYRSDVLAEFIDRVSGLNPAHLVQRQTGTFAEIPPGECHRMRGAGIDPSDAQGGNGFALVITDADIVKSDEDGSDKLVYRVVCYREWQTGGVENAIRECAKVCAEYGLFYAQSDRYAGPQNVALAKRYDLEIEARRSTTEETTNEYLDLATRISTGDLWIANNPTLIRDLVGIRKVATPTGFRIELPLTADGRHGDSAPALVASLRVTSAAKRPLMCERWTLQDYLEQRDRWFNGNGEWFGMAHEVFNLDPRGGKRGYIMDYFEMRERIEKKRYPFHK
jgi:hypothetical protein